MKTPAISEKKPTHTDKDTNKRDAQTFYTNYKIVKKKFASHLLAEEENVSIVASEHFLHYQAHSVMTNFSLTCFSAQAAVLELPPL